MDIIYFVLGATSLIFFILYFNIRKRFINLVSGFQKLYEANQILRSLVDDMPTKEEEDIHKENFIKFLSDSREWAYDYIDNVQSGLEKFINEVEPHVEYYDNYGQAVEGMIISHDNALKKISLELKELKKLLPEDSSDRR